jgi:hypothetical protein
MATTNIPNPTFLSKKEKKHQYYLNNKDHIKQRSKENRLKKPDQYKAKDKERYKRKKHILLPQMRKRGNEKRVQDKLKVISHYSKGINSCECCKEKYYEFLSIDHINGGGRKHRKEVVGNNKIYEWLIKNKFPIGYRVLCMNCNFAEGRYGYCPHKVGSKKLMELGIKNGK